MLLKLLEAMHVLLTLAASLGANLEVCYEDRGWLWSHCPGTSISAVSWDGSTLGGSQLPPKVLRGSLIQPVGIHHAEVSHVALVGIE